MTERTRNAKASKSNLDELEQALKGKAGGKSRLDQFELEEEDDVYEVVDEDEYEKLVEKRRGEEDFVVDDDGLGYHDNGEEIMGVPEESRDAKRRLQEAARQGDSNAAKKARRIAEASSGQRGSILKHLQTGISGTRVASAKEVAPQALMDINALMGDSAAQPKRSVAPTIHRPAPINNRLPPRPNHSSAPRYNTVSRPQGESSTHESDYQQDDGGDGQYDDINDNNEGYEQQAAEDAMDVSSPAASTQPAKEDPSVVAAQIEAQKISLSKSTKKLTKSEPVKQPLSAFDSVLMFQPTSDSGSSGTMSALAAIDSGTPSEVGNGGKIDPKQWLIRTPTAEGEPKVDDYVNMYWLDASENNGLLYLFGKVPLNDPTAPTGTPPRFVSCCVIVHGSERNLFVLPKVVPDEFNEDGSARRVDFLTVHKEMTSLLVPNIVPRQQGQSFKCKSVKRKYAFEHGSVPRENTDYLKIVYSARHGAPNPAQCLGGEKNSFERIFGATSSPLELFILKRKLMGPCWITIKNPRLNPDTASWCKVEFGVEDPKFVSKMASKDAPPVPSLVSMCISMKTAVNPSTHVHELIAISGLVHTKVDSEADSDLNAKLMKRFTFIRPLGLSCGNSYPAQFPHDIAAEFKKQADGNVIQTCVNERAMLSLFFTKLKQEDPDIMASHNLLGFEFDIILSRATVNKLPDWSLLGRLKKTKIPKSINERDVAAGRILCDTYKAAKEFLRETTYSLSYLAQSQLQYNRHDVDPIDVPKYFSTSADIAKLALHTSIDSLLVQRLMLKLQVVPLTKQLTSLSGNLWSKTIRGARAERIEYLLLHEFHALKFILPEKKAFQNDKKGGNVHRNNASIEDDGEELETAGGGGAKVGGSSRKRQKASYAGGLVLEPKKGLYDTYILLLDFNSLYPSIIQEYNLCFTTIDWSKYMPDPTTGAAAVALTSSSSSSSSAVKKVKKVSAEGEEGGETDDDESDGENDANAIAGNGASGASNKSLPPLPEPSSEAGILPRVIKNLVDRRREVKKLLKNCKEQAMRQTLDIRQKALKLTANSMYGCLGFSFSRFYARPIAALVTSQGREALQRTVDLATNQMGLDVIYGDTDSVMINTNLTELSKVKEIGNLVKKEVNLLYKALELDLDGIFKSMLLLKKKKYAAVVITENADGSVSLEKELKGLDLVRRDWCPLSKDTGKFTVDQILSGKPREEIVMAIHEYLADLAQKVRGGEIDLLNFVVTKGLNKNPKDYPDCKGQAHLQVALAMLKANKPVNIGDHIPYVICVQGPDGSHAAQRAYHPDEVLRSNGALTLDYEWYLTNQILPPISRLCEPIEGTSPAIMSERLGLDASKFKHMTQNEDGMEDGWGFTPKCQMDDAERFKDCLKLRCICSQCHVETDFSSILSVTEANGRGGLDCTNCGSLYFGLNNASDCYCYLSNRISILVRDCVRRYYECWLVCDDHSCGRRTMQQSAKGFACTEDCHGRMVQEYDESALHTQLKYLESLFDVARLQSKKGISDSALNQYIPREQVGVLNLLRQHMSNSVNGSAYNWVRPSLWSALFGKAASAATVAK